MYLQRDCSSVIHERINKHEKICHPYNYLERLLYSTIDAFFRQSLQGISVTSDDVLAAVRVERQVCQVLFDRLLTHPRRPRGSQSETAEMARRKLSSRHFARP